MSRTAIFVCLEPRRSEWQLGALPPPVGRMTLIGWKEDPVPVEAGIPKAVAAVLARAFTSIGRITFPSSAAHASAGGSWLPLKRGRGSLEMMSTTDPETVVRAFGDSTHPWWMQGQVLLISTPGAVTPDFAKKQILALLENEWTAAAELAPLDVIGILRPGVDGAVAGLLTLTADVEAESLDALEREALRASFDWSLLTEDAFAAALST